MHSKETLTIQDSPMEVLVFEPAGEGKVPGVVVAQHLPIAHQGLEKDPFTLDVGEKLAAAGYVTVIPYMFHWWAPEVDIEVKRAEWRDDRTVEDLTATHEMLCAHPRVDAARTAIIGHCWGGRMAWLGACHNPNYKAMATLYGGRIKIGMGEGNPPPIELSDRIPCPVIGIFGNDDQNPSPADVDDLDSALAAAGVPHEFHRYDGAGHGFQDFVDENRYRPEATADAWAKVLEFFDRHLK